MRIEYRGIDLGDLTEVLEFSHTPEHDTRGNYLYTKVRIRVRFFMNEDAVAYNLRLGLITIKPDTLPATTVSSIRHVLSIPRGQLIVTDIGDPNGRNGGEILRCPANGETADCQGGPFVLEGLSVIEVVGSATYHGEFEVDCHINECDQFKNTVSVLLSHTWSMTEEIDWQERSTRTITGQAHFHAQRLIARGGYPDDFRQYLFHPVPDNMERVDIKVNATEDGLGVQYSIVDRTPFVHIPDTRVKKIEGCHAVSYSQASAEKIALEGILLAARTAGRAAQVGVEAASAAQGVFGPAAAILVGAAGAIRTTTEAGIDAYHTALAILPRLHHAVKVRVWGSVIGRDAPVSAGHSHLSRVAHRIVAARLSRISRSLYCREVSEVRALDDNMVEVTMNLTSGIMAPLVDIFRKYGVNDPRPDAQTIMTVVSGLHVPVDLRRSFPSTTVVESLSFATPEGIPTADNPFPGMDAVMTHANQSGKSFSNGAIDHVNLGRVVASALLAPCTLVRRPGAQVLGPRRDFPVVGDEPIQR